MTRVLILAATTGYQTRSFGEAAERLGVELVFATDRCHLIEDPWQDQAIPIRFHEEDASVAAIVAAAKVRGIDGVLAVGDRPTVIAARVARALGLAGHPPEAAAIARHKLRTRERLLAAACPFPGFFPWPFSSLTIARSEPLASSPTGREQPLSYPCVVKPVALSGSRGVMRADDPAAFAAAFDAAARASAVAGGSRRAERGARDCARRRLHPRTGVRGRGAAASRRAARPRDLRQARTARRAVLRGDDVRDSLVCAGRHPGSDRSGRHPRREGDRPAPRTCPRRVPRECRRRLRARSGRAPDRRPVRPRVALRACRASGLGIGIRIPNPESPFPLEELLLRHALGEAPDDWRRESDASGVMMIPIPRRGILRRVDGLDAARDVPDIDDISITAKPDQLLVPLPEGASYLGFIFARASSVSAVRAGAACGARAARLRHRAGIPGTHRRADTLQSAAWLIPAGTARQRRQGPRATRAAGR